MNFVLPEMQFVEFQVCRGCLATDSRMVDTRQSSASDFTHLVELLPTAKAGLPPCVCYECLAQLTKMRDFHAKNQRAYNVLLRIIRQRGRIEETDIKQINRTRQSLASSLKYHRIESISIEPEFSYSEVAVEDRKDEINPKLTEMHDDFKIEVPQEEKMKSEGWFEDFNSFFDDENNDVTTTDVTVENKAEKENVKETEQKEVETERKEGKNAKNIMPKSRKRKTSKENSELEPGAKVQKLPKIKQKETPKVNPMKCNFTEDYHSIATVTVMTEEERLEVFKQRGEKKQYINAVYKCTDCLYGFTSIGPYEQHRMKHDPDKGAYVCPICKCRYKTHALRKKHIAMTHRTKFECKNCPHVCTSGQLAKMHSEKHSSATYRCKECNFVSGLQASYDLHVSTKHGDETPCPSCGVSFLDLVAMRKHMASTHPAATRKKRNLRCQCKAVFYNHEARKLHLSTSSKHNPGGSTLLSCALCDSRFTDKQSLQAHMLTHPQERKESAASGPQYINLTCEQCGEVMPDRKAYKSHYRMLHPDKTYSPTAKYPDMLCDVCGKILKGQYSLREHSFSHMGLRPLVCKICGKTFARRMIFDSHMNTHTKPLVYKCRICGKGFNYPGNRDRHLRVHSQERLFSCDICGKCFKSQVEKLAHTKYVHMKKPWPKRNRSKRKATQRQQCSDQDSSD